MLPIVILAGGLATRLGSLTHEIPKCLLKVNGRPFIDLQLELLQSSGYQDIVLCLSFQAEKVISYIGNGKRYGVNIEFSIDGPTQLGTGGAIRKVLSKVGPEFAVIYGDSYLPINYREVEREFLNSKALGLMTVFENRDKLDVSNVDFFNSSVRLYSKVPSQIMKHIDYGLNYFRSEAIEHYKFNEPFDLADVLSQLSIQGKLIGFEVFTRFYEIGSLQGIKDLSFYLQGAQE
jgi:MurNAc alpha-1-phosphate uridylyltransferase